MKEGKLRRRKGRFLCLVLCLVTVMMAVCGCKSGIPIVSNVKENYDYPKSQAMIVIATERNRYENAYTDAIWNVTLENGQTFEAYLLEQIKAFLKDLKTMNLLAESQEIALTSSEKDRIRQVAENYYGGLSQSEISYMGITLEDVNSMYQEYYMANKVVGELTKEVNLEVSDSEAKVISVRQIVMSDREKADAAYEKVVAEGSDFASIAREVTEGDTIERQIGRGEETKTVEEAVFALASGEVSPVVEADGTCYIFQCVSDYEVEATKKRKTRLYEERKNQVFQQIYAQFQTEHEITFSDEIWAGIHFSKDDPVTSNNFFSLYQEEFGGQGY